MTIASTHLIHTGLYTDIAAHAINHGAIGQCSDGRGEANPKNAKYWEFLSVKRAADDEVMLEVKEGYDSYYGVESAFNRKTDFQVKEWVANYLKGTVKCEMEDGNGIGAWKRENTAESCYAGDIRVCDAYLVYETLKGRSRAAAKYPRSVVESVVGHAMTPEMRAKREAVCKIKAEAAQKMKELQEKHAAELAELQKATEAEIQKINA